MEKLCIFCQHFQWDRIEICGGSTWTGSWMEGGLSCNAVNEQGRRHFYEERPDDIAEFRQLILRAVTCPDYLPPEQQS